MTSAITFREVVVAIKETAFVTSPYPVILSLEMHCKAKQQERIAQYFIDIFGQENIYVLPDDIENIKQFPSPEELKYKYIIKCKAPRKMPESLLKT